MRIAIICSNDEKRKELVTNVVTQWGGTFPTPAVTLFDEKVTYPERFNTDDFTKKWENENENDLYMRLLFNADQLETYRTEKNIIYNGCSLDIVANALLMNEQELVSDEFVEAAIYRSRDNIRNLDLIYYLPIKLEDIEDETEQRLEQLYYGIVSEYLEENTSTGVFPAHDCPAVVLLETDNPINEIRGIVNSDGNLNDEGESPEQIQALMNAIKDPKMRQNIERILQTPSIPLVGGGTASSGEIEL